jgi:hypothetical protein
MTEANAPPKLEQDQQQAHRAECQELRQRFQRGALFAAAFVQAKCAGRWGIVPGVIWLMIAFVIATCRGAWGEADAILTYGSAATITVYSLGPYLCTLISLYWLRDSNISVSRAAVALTLLADAVHLGWTIILCSAQVS